MARRRTHTGLILEWWKDGDWYVGQICELPGVLSQGATLEELRANIREAYGLVMEDYREQSRHPHARTERIAIPG